MRTSFSISKWPYFDDITVIPLLLQVIIIVFWSRCNAPCVEARARIWISKHTHIRSLSLSPVSLALLYICIASTSGSSFAHCAYRSTKCTHLSTLTLLHALTHTPHSSKNIHAIFTRQFLPLFLYRRHSLFLFLSFYHYLSLLGKQEREKKCQCIRSFIYLSFSKDSRNILVLDD